MTLGKHYNSWLREAGRGHFAGILSWGIFLPYLIIKFMMLTLDTEYVFFGIGNSGLAYVCGGLGLCLALMEFFYLLQPKKLDFYYSLPVKKSTIFWCRYVHGILTFTVPFLLVMAACTVFEAGRSEAFASCAGTYFNRSIVLFFLLFLLFYHIGMLSALAAGRIASVIFTGIGLIFFMQFMVQYILLGFSKRIFQTFYRIPLFEEMGIILSPAKLSEQMTGASLFEKNEVLDFIPKSSYVLAAVVWILILLVLSILVQRQRRVEMTGKLFIVPSVERVIEFFTSVLAGLTVGRLLLSAFQSLNGSVLAGILCIGAIAGTVLTHALAERLIRMPKKNRIRRRGQMASAGVLACVFVVLFFAVKGPFDRFHPEYEQLEGLSVCVNGLDMEQSQYEMTTDKNYLEYVAEERMMRYTLKDEGMEKASVWLSELSGEQAGDEITTVTVCYEMKDGREKFRTYSVDTKELLAFADVYETEEYKRLAYPLIQSEPLDKERMTWSDGVTESVLKLSGQEKNDFLSAYKSDVSEMKLADLRTEYAAGKIKVESRISGKQATAIIYPFFDRTCAFLEEHGIGVGKKLADYPVLSLKIQKRGASGGSVQFYDEKEEMDVWIKELIPQELAVQPLFLPANASVEGEAEVEDIDSSSSVRVECFGVEEEPVSDKD